MPSQYSYVPHYIRIREQIRERIQLQVYKVGSRIPSEAAFAQEFDVSRITVTNALRELAKEGLLVREQGRGTFVAPGARHQSRSRLAGLLVRTQGHLFADLSRFLSRELNAVGYLPALVDLTSLEEAEEVERLAHLCQAGMKVLIAEGMMSLPYRRIAEMSSDLEKVIFIWRYESAEVVPGAVHVLSDLRSAAQQVYDHLLEQGHRRVLVLTHMLGEHPLRVSAQLLNHFTSLAAEGGEIEVQAAAYHEDQPVLADGLREILTSPTRPTAVFSLSDFRVRIIYELAEEVGLSIPNDLALVGFYNTPWCQMLPVPLTSVDLRVDNLAEQTAAVLQGNRQSAGTIWVRPQLIVRSSSL